MNRNMSSFNWWMVSAPIGRRILPLLLVLGLAACQASATQREAPTPAALYGGALQPVTEPVVLRLRPLGTVQLAATMRAKAEARGHQFTWMDSISGQATIDAAGEGLLRLHAVFRVGSHELNDDLDVEPFSLDVLMMDLGVIRDAEWRFAAADHLSDSQQSSIISTIISLFPIISWPEQGIPPGEPFSAVNFQVTRADVVVRETGDLDLTIAGGTVFDGRPAYLIGFSGRAQSLANNEAISGYYVVDAQSGFVLEHRHAGRDKTYELQQQILVYRDLDVEAQLRP